MSQRMAAAAKTVICLFRNDLRYHDNEILQWAHRNGDFVLPVYCFDPRHYKGTYHYNFPKTGAHRLKFLLESVQDLRKVLTDKGSGLIVRHGIPEVVLPEIIQSLGKDNIKALVYQKEVTQEELDVEEALRSKCGISIQAVWGHTLYHKDDLPFPVKQLPDVYSQFRKKVEDGCPVRQLLQMPEKLRPLPASIEPGDIPDFQALGVQAIPEDTRSAVPFIGGETAALKRLQFYLWDSDNVATYKETRNGMIGSDYSTKFSAWLTHGCLSPRKIYWEIKRYERERTANQSTYWVIFELLWRDYFRYVAMKYGNHIFFPGGIQRKNVPWKKDMKLFEAWQDGKTGVPYVDANMRELAATGFMSNRGRQNVASFLTKDLKLDWRLGAEWFESQLIDSDVCSNYGNWLYSAGIGNDPREDRKFNMVKQGLDYDPNGDYVRLWIPELAGLKGGEVHTVWALSAGQLAGAGVSLGETYPKPLLVAPEWNRHQRKPGNACGARGSSAGRIGPPPKQRGIDFYFKGGSHPR